MKGGIGTASLTLGNGVVVAALVAVNCVGNVIDPKTGQIIAGSRSPKGTGFVDVMEWYSRRHSCRSHEHHDRRDRNERCPSTRRR